MNDRYLCKAKQKDWRELPKEEWWVIGHYVKTDGIPYIYKLQGNEDAQRIYRIDESTLCRCTGLKDKNGKLIWENDICDRKELFPEIVKYHEGDWTLDYSYAFQKTYGFDYCNLGFYVCKRKCVEVIGNIFDNPELLEAEKCKNCTYFGRAGDAPETVAMDCMWQPGENEDYEGLPCEECR